MPSARSLAPLAALALLLAPAAAADSLADDQGDAEGGPDALDVAWLVGEATIILEVRFAPGELPDDRAVRGLVLLGAPGSAEPAEWYQVTIADETHAFAGHDGPADVAIVGASWTGDLASVELARRAPAPAASASCVLAVVEAGRLTPDGFVRSDVAPRGYASPEEAWGETSACPAAEPAGSAQPKAEGKGSPALPLLGLLAALGAAGLSRRR